MCHMPSTQLPVKASPDVRLLKIICHQECVLEASQRYVKLRSMETAEAHVVPELCIGHAQHQKPPVEAQGHLWLVCIEVLSCHACNRLHIAGLQVQHSFIKGQTGLEIVQSIVYPCFSKKIQRIFCTPDNMKSATWQSG